MNANDIQTQGVQLWADWAAMWNGDLARAGVIIADGFRANLTSTAITDPAQLRDARAVAAWVARIRGRYGRLVYTTVAGPFVDLAQGVVSSPWFADGIYAGRTGVPADVEGRAFRKAGLDLLKFRDGRIYECWTINNDVDIVG